MATGQTFERAQIEEWLVLRNSCPLSHVVLESKNLRPNFALRDAIEEWRERVGWDQMAPAAPSQEVSGTIERKLRNLLLILIIPYDC